MNTNCPHVCSPPVSVSPPKLQPVISSLESSPEPEKISLEDLTGILPGTPKLFFFSLMHCSLLDDETFSSLQIQQGILEMLIARGT